MKPLTVLEYYLRGFHKVVVQKPEARSDRRSAIGFRFLTHQPLASSVAMKRAIIRPTTWHCLIRWSLVVGAMHPEIASKQQKNSGLSMIKGKR